MIQCVLNSALPTLTTLVLNDEISYGFVLCQCVLDSTLPTLTTFVLNDEIS